MVIQRLRRFEARPGAYLRLDLSAVVSPGAGEQWVEESTLIFGECSEMEISLRGDGLPQMRSALEALSASQAETAGGPEAMGDSGGTWHDYRLEFDVGHIAVRAMRYSFCITRTHPSIPGRELRELR